MTKLAELLKEATPGPWKVAGPMEFGDVHLISKAGNRYIMGSDQRPQIDADAALIAAAVNSLPLLLDVLSAARTYLAADGNLLPLLEAETRLRASIAAYDSEVGASQVEHLSNADYAVAMAEYQNSTDGEGGQGA